MRLEKKHKKFKRSKKEHILLITNHGCHAPIIKATTDTAGQNFYVNYMADAFLSLGYKVTILNRGGFRHSVTKEMHRGILYYDKVWGRKGYYCRLIYLEDGVRKFIRKESLKLKNLSKEASFFLKVSREIGLEPDKIFFINSHYWDGGILGLIINQKLSSPRPHFWTPHSLGRLKKARYKKRASEGLIDSFNFPSRIRNEEKIIAQADGIVSTSYGIGKALFSYRAKPKNHLWLPPGIDLNLFKPRRIKKCSRALEVLQDKLKLEKKKLIELLKSKIVFLEISRTTASKQKRLLLESFSLLKNQDKAVLFLRVHPQSDVYQDIFAFYKKLEHKERVVLLEKAMHPIATAQLFSLADVYVTPSLMEGWGMSVQQAAASRCAIISSKLVPFVTEVLRSQAIVVEKNQAHAYSKEMDRLIERPKLRKRLAQKSYLLASRHHSWKRLARRLIVFIKKK